MYCPRCGEPIEDDSRFCKRCGYRLVESNPKYQTSFDSYEPPKRKSGCFIAGVIVALLLVFACIWFINQGVFDGSELSLEDEHVTYVKNGSPSLYPSITYGEAFGDFFSNGKWRYFEADSGEDVVEFTGNCLYRDQEVEVRLQFILHIKESTFDIGYMSFNEVPQTTFVTYALIEKVFESYQEDHYTETFRSQKK